MPSIHPASGYGIWHVATGGNSSIISVKWCKSDCGLRYISTYGLWLMAYHHHLFHCSTSPNKLSPPPLSLICCDTDTSPQVCKSVSVCGLNTIYQNCFKRLSEASRRAKWEPDPGCKEPEALNVLCSIQTCNSSWERGFRVSMGFIFLLKPDTEWPHIHLSDLWCHSAVSSLFSCLCSYSHASE